MKRLAHVLPLLLVLFSEASRAENAVPNYQIYQPYVSPRALGMGNAFTALADDYTALFYNPAGLARLQEGQVNLAITAGVDNKVNAFVEDLNVAMDSNNASTDLANLIADNYGNHYWARVTPVAAAWVRPGWGVALIPADLSVDLALHQQVGPSVEAIAINDTTLAIGFAKTLKNTGAHRFSIGLTLKPMYRAYYEQAVPAPQLATDQNIIKKELAQEGATIDADVGILWSFPAESGFMKAIQPTLGLVVRNVGDYGFPLKTSYITEEPKSPPKLERRVDVGTRFELPSFWVFKPRLMIDERDIGARNFTYLKGAHAGFELDWKVRSWLHGGYRAGYSQGYWSMGVTLALGIFMLDVASWGEEVGTSGAKKENRRYMARASLDF